jgi:hypothetical protein
VDYEVIQLNQTIDDLYERLKRLKKERDEAREAAREMAEYRPVPDDVRADWERRFSWL